MMSRTRQRTQIGSVPLPSGLCTLSGGDDMAQPQGGSVQRAGASVWGSPCASGGFTAPQEPPRRGGELSKVSHKPRTPTHRALGVHRVDDATQPSHPLSSPSPPTVNLSQPSGSFQMSQLFASDGQSIDAFGSWGLGGDKRGQLLESWIQKQLDPSWRGRPVSCAS